MSHKQAKLNRQKQRMEKEQAQYSFDQLQNYILLCQMLTGTKPKELEIVDGYYNWYVQEVQKYAEQLGMVQGFKDDKVTFSGVELKKKIKIETPKN